MAIARKYLLYVSMPVITLSRMMHAYGYRRNPEDLRATGAETIWCDLEPGRYQRAAMMGAGALRPGDTLILFKLRDLGGSPVADEKWREKIESKGVTIRLIDPPASSKPIGRPRKYSPDSAAARRHWAVWTNGDRSEVDRLTEIAADNGSPVTRQTLNGRYGNPSNPKPAPN